MGGGDESLRGIRVLGKRCLFPWGVGGVGKKLNRVLGRRRLGRVKIPDLVPMPDTFKGRLGFAIGVWSYLQFCHVMCFMSMELLRFWARPGLFVTFCNCITGHHLVTQPNACR